MEEAIVGSVVGATVQVVLQNLLSMPIEEFNLFRDFKKDLKKLKDSFLMIQNFLYDAEMQQVTNKAVNCWLKKLESVAFDADNVFDELNYHVLCNKIETQKNMTKKVRAFFTHSNPIWFRLQIARKIKDINENLKLINQEARDFGLQIMKPMGAGIDVVAGRETDSFAVDLIVQGREDDVSRIVEMLTTNPTEQAFSVLPIVGMGGLGKTMLARQVFHNEKIKAHFDQQIWVYVSGSFDALTIFKNILESLTIEKKFEFGNREAVLRKLQKDLGHKRYLLVLDDVWNEERESWDDFANSLSGISYAMGNGMIVTTRGEKVASIVKTLPIYRLKGLSQDKCWSIIKAKAFKEVEVPSEFETIGRNIADKCQGLPLASKVVGGLLCDKSKDEWLTIEKTWLSNFGKDENTILKVLKLSFDHLSLPSLKKCFSYCSIFPKGFRIEREGLIELWMAEGFLTIDRSNEMETVGSNFFNLLVQNSLLQVVVRDKYDNIKSCDMHDLVHDLASSVSGSKNNCVYSKSLEDIHQVRYTAESCPIPKEQARFVRTLIYECEASDNMFLDFKNLHVLILNCEDIKEMPSLISELIHLRLVDITQTRIESLPDSIGKLCHLQTLRAVAQFVWESHLRKLPNTLKNLVNLRHLHIPNIELPPNVGRLTSLQTLQYFKIGNEKGCRIGELGGLKNLKGKLEIHNLERVDDKEEAKNAHLFQKPNIFDLKFAWNKSRKGQMNDENVLEGLQPHPNLRSLEIYGFKGKRFPSWTLKMGVHHDLEGHWIGLSNLIEITLKDCDECEEIPMLGHLPFLKSLCLDGLTNVRSIDSSFCGINNDSISSRVGKNTIILFPALERLMLMKMSNLRDWVEVEFPSIAETVVPDMVVFPRLEYLLIIECLNLTSAPSHFPCLKALEINGMDSPLPLANICGSNIISLTKLGISCINGLVCLPDTLFCNNKNLSWLGIWDCPNLTHLVLSLRGGGASLRLLEIFGCSNLRELPYDLHLLNSLVTLRISFCPNLNSIPYPSGLQSHEGFTSLHDLSVYDCKGLTTLPIEMIQSCAPSLEILRLKGLNSLTNLQMVIGCLQKMPWLTTLEIVDIPKFTYFSMEIGSLHSLRELQIGVLSSDALDYRLVQEFLDDFFKGLQPLRVLDFYGIERWDSLPNQLQYLTAVTNLRLDGFEIEALPEWLGNMSSLQIIWLFYCKKLRRLPSKEAMQRLTKLTQLCIYECPLLNVQRCNEQQSDDSQWPNISHIPNVTVNGRQI